MEQRKAKLMVVGSALLAIAPKCPFCLLAFFGFVGVVTVPGSLYRASLAPLTAVWLTFTVAMLFVQNSGKRRLIPGFLGLFAALSVFAGKFIVNNQILMYTGIAALLGAAIWITWFQTPTSSGPCAQCERPPILHEEGD